MNTPHLFSNNLMDNVNPVEGKDYDSILTIPVSISSKLITIVSKIQIINQTTKT
jgi:hypothetical protein